MYKKQERRLIPKHTCSLVLTTHSGFVTIVVATPAPEAATMFAPTESGLSTSAASETTEVRHHTDFSFFANLSICTKETIG